MEVPVTLKCPRCRDAGWSAGLNRVERRFVDRLVSVVWPLHRYRCRMMGCGWEGNLSARRAAQRDGPRG